MDKRIHIALCLPDNAHGLPNNVIRHNALALQHGAVWFGKPDRPFPGGVINHLDQQLIEGQ